MNWRGLVLRTAQNVPHGRVDCVSLTALTLVTDFRRLVLEMKMATACAKHM